MNRGNAEREYVLAQRGQRFNPETVTYGPFIEFLRRDFETGLLYGYGRSGGDLNCESAWRIDEPISDYFQKMIGDLPIPPVMAKWDL